MLRPVGLTDNDNPRWKMLKTHRRIGDIAVLAAWPGCPEGGYFALLFEFVEVHLSLEYRRQQTVNRKNFYFYCYLYFYR